MGAATPSAVRREETRQSRLLLRLLLLVLSTSLVSGYKSVVVRLATWLNATFFDEGPTVLVLSQDHGLHRMDLVVIVAALLPVLLLPGGWLWWIAKRRGTRAARTPAGGQAPLLE